jgi:hypothetical protein
MAKTKGALFGLGASGQLAKTIVFGSWKGIGTAREYVEPSNPNTALQQTQRGYMTAAVAAFHAAAFSVADMTAWAKLASIQSKVMSGFNIFCKTHIAEAIAGNVWEPISACVVSLITNVGWTTTVTKVSGGNAPHLWVGTRPTFLSDEGALADLGGNSWALLWAGGGADTDYYFSVIVGATGTDLGRLGIYKVRTIV